MTIDNTSANSTPTADAAGTWRLGDRTVNRIGFGAMRLTGMPWDEKPRDRAAAIAVLRRAIELGVNHIDTAAFYFLPTRSANELICTALQPYPDDLVITTKVGPARSRDGAFEYARPDQLRAQVEENIRQLGLDHLDVVNLRWGAGLDKEPGSLAEHFGALAELREAGLVRHLGVSNIGAEQLIEAMAIAPVVCVQNRYGLTERQDEALAELCAEHGVAFVPFFAVATSVPGATPHGGHDETGRAEVAEVAKAHGATPAQVRLAWTLHRGPHVLAIPGTGDLAHLEENIAAGALRLSDDELTLLDGITTTG
ncbi:aryl-alcohol dehydrogenase-like predicted oxidoreductase [Thermocatellispora tengchongensis]|uniref:Aryl-alcohol dehydrogenase-like predicted oxidoreductase n=1 Tax=Thermocatellispora tengchongensis TaxID=1073253 RepID=A0A840P7A0_9ACTN|nr:oxidoreductase [Thermocatellispora tengchongensis]MBB5135548.1 aryl-alcohol dehydrogenase-like predicted oxidoreductase [Thermocatellispora tengchongensis]